MIFIDERVRQIEQQYAHLVQDVLVLRLTDETLKLVLVLNDGTTLRVAERWRGSTLARYSYYWLDAGDRLKIGWDNSPHHTQLESFPHHKHVGERMNLAVSSEMSLEDVMAVVEQEMAEPRMTQIDAEKNP